MSARNLRTASLLGAVLVSLGGAASAECVVNAIWSPTVPANGVVDIRVDNPPRAFSVSVPAGASPSVVQQRVFEAVRAQPNLCAPGASTTTGGVSNTLVQPGALAAIGGLVVLGALAASNSGSSTSTNP